MEIAAKEIHQAADDLFVEFTLTELEERLEMCAPQATYTTSKGYTIPEYFRCA